MPARPSRRKQAMIGRLAWRPEESEPRSATLVFVYIRHEVESIHVLQPWDHHHAATARAASEGRQQGHARTQ